MSEVHLPAQDQTSVDTKAKHLDLLKKSLSDMLNVGSVQITPYAPGQGKFYKRWGINWLVNFLAKKKVRLVMDSEEAIELRKEGIGWPVNGLTMVGMKRLDNIQFCVEDVIKNNIPGDVIETGVWRGGSVIFMKAILDLHGVTDKKVWVADSFEGLPAPDEKKYPDDAGDDLYTVEQLRVTKEQVEHNFRKYGVLDDNVKFLKGWFKDTLPTAPIDQLSIIRLDGDMYESTMDGLVNLYHKLSPGGHIIIDDYGFIPACAKAVHDFRDAHGITEQIIEIDKSGVYWQKM